MKYLNLTKSLAILAMLSLVFAACKKAKVATPMGDAGQILVKILGGGTPSAIAKKPVDFVPTPTKILAIELRRDVPNETELNKTMVVTVKDDTAAVTAQGYLHLPTAWFTTQTDAVKTGGQGGTWTFTFKPGEFSKSLYVTIPDATLLNPSALYGLGFTVLTADGGAKLSTQKSVVVEIGAKNVYDGVYEVTGTLSDVSPVAGANLFGPWLPSWEALLVTTGANSVNVEDNTYTGLVAHPFHNNGAPTYYGSFGMIVFFNNATGAVTEVRNWWGVVGNAAGASGPPNYAASNDRRALLDPSGVNMFNSATHNIDIKYWMLQPSVMGSLTPRTYFNENWKYTGPR